MTGRSGLALALSGGLAFGFATPPAIVPFGEWLVVPALMVWFVLATDRGRPLRHSYLFGCVHMAWFSWSILYAFVPPYFAIVLLGGVYYLLATLAVRSLPGSWRVPAFAIVVAGSFWLRASVPDIHYPHGQPSHAFWQWPWLLRCVALGGEPLANALLAACAAAAVEVVRSWRTARPSWRGAWLGLVAAFTCWMGANLIGWTLRPAPSAEQPVCLDLVEPGFRPHEVSTVERSVQLLRERLIAPTQEVLRGDRLPDLVVWPESSWPQLFLAEDLAAGRGRMNLPLAGGDGCRLLVGGLVEIEAGDSPTALLVELPRGRILGRQDKQFLVPGGEFLPLVFLLPEAWAEWLCEAIEQTVGALPRCVPGAAGEPLHTADGVPFGTLMCYDNAFPQASLDRVGRGAELLVVLSNESWFDGGSELVQLAAMSVIRALETGTPIVRCTSDGWTGAIDGDGNVLAELDLRPAPQPAARILRVLAPRGPGRAPPMAMTQRLSGPVAGLLLALALAHGAVRWVRIRSARTALPAAAGSGPSGGSSGGS